MSIAIASFISSVFQPAADLIDSMHTSVEEKMQAKGVLLDKVIQFIGNALKYEARTLEARAKIVEAEAKSNNWLTSSWRPITMLTFLVIIVGAAFGLLDMSNLDNVPEEMWSLLKIGIGGYIGGRSAEKVTGSIVGYLKQKDGKSVIEG